MNRHKAGKIFERELGAMLIRSGWLRCYYVPPSAMYHNSDILGMFDIYGLSASYPTRHILIQAKKNISHYYSAKKELKSWMLMNLETEYEGGFFLMCIHKKILRVWDGFFEAQYNTHGGKITTALGGSRERVNKQPFPMPPKENIKGDF